MSQNKEKDNFDFKPNTQAFHRKMTRRHLMMLAFGGVIGTGLFVATGQNLRDAGPFGTLLAYLMGAIIIYTVMLSLGELSSKFPHTASFGEYAHRFISPSTGYIVAWLYWLTWVAALGGEFTAVGILMQKWFPDIEVWVFASIFGVIIFILNIWTVRIFAEGEFLFSTIKVVAVILFLLIGFSVIFYKIFVTGIDTTFENFYINGIFPNGASAVLMTILAVNFAFSGTEVIGVAVGETKDPHLAMPRAINATLWRLVVFFLGTVFIIATLLPSNDARLAQSPFVAVLESLNIPYAGDIMSFVILMAIFSVSNSGLYASARMLWGLGDKKAIHPIFRYINKRGIPVYAVIFSMLGALSALFSKVYAPEIVFSVLIGVSGFAAILTWMSISLAQLNFRKEFIKLGGDLKTLPYVTPFMPYIPIIALTLCVLSIIGAFFDATQRTSIYATLIFIVICYISYYFHIKKNRT